MHYKDGTEAHLGDIIQHDSGHVGIVIGGTIGSDYCSTQVACFLSTKVGWPGAKGAGYLGELKDAKGVVLKNAGVAVSFMDSMQTREMVKIGHVDIGHG